MAAEGSLPSILVIITDDQPASSLSEMPKTYRSGNPASPALLGDLGTEFSDAHVTEPLCGPSRATIMTGLYPHTHEVYNHERCARRYWEKGHAVGSLYYRLANEAGYTCAHYGKTLNGYEEIPARVFPGVARGRWISPLGQYGSFVKANRFGQVRTTNIRPKEETAWLAKNAADFVTEMTAAGQPFFCVASVHSPHAPYTPSDAHRGSYAGVPMPEGESFNHQDPNKPEHLDTNPLTDAELAAIRTEWRGKMEELQDADDAVGSMCAEVDFDSTYVFFVSDNGYLLGEHSLTQKGLPYREATRVPFLVRGPGVVAGATSDLLVSLSDLAPTVYELAGLPERAEACDGRSLLGPMMGADEEALGWRESLLIEQYRETEKDKDIRPWKAIRTKTALYVEHQTAGGGVGERELYDLVSDPHEKASLQNDPAASAEMAGLSGRLARVSGAEGEALRAAEEGVGS